MKTKAPALPFFVSVSDYHSFDLIERVMRLINPKIKVSEIHFDDYPLSNFSYIALVHEGRVPSKKAIIKLFEDESSTLHDFDVI